MKIHSFVKPFSYSSFALGWRIFWRSVLLALLVLTVLSIAVTAVLDNMDFGPTITNLINIAVLTSFIIVFVIF